MSYEGQDGLLDYSPCTYGESQTRFRGPAVPIDVPFTAVLGSSDVYGKYVETTFCDHLSAATGRSIANLGVLNGGVDVYVRDPALMAVIEAAEDIVIQITGAGNLSNRYYSVHPRRNDRFLRQSRQMTRLFPTVDFSDFTFTGHMLRMLQSTSPACFEALVVELRTAWLARMQMLLRRIRGGRTLLWIENSGDDPAWAEPLFVTVDMIQTLGADADRIVHCEIDEGRGEPDLEGMVFPEMERRQAARMLPPSAHDRVGEVLSRALGRPEDSPRRRSPPGQPA
jgi:hypothetical protein